MRSKLFAFLILLSSVPAAAEAQQANSLPAQGNLAVVSGRAHIERSPLGTYINIENIDGVGSVAGFVAFGDDGTYPGLSVEGRNVEIVGVVVLNGRATISMTAPDQLKIKG